MVAAACPQNVLSVDQKTKWHKSHQHGSLWVYSLATSLVCLSEIPKSSAGDENRFISGPTDHGISAASTFPSTYLLASGDIVNLPQLGGVALSTAFGIFIACAHSLINLLRPSGNANSGATRNVEAPASGTKIDDETEILSTKADGWEDQDQKDSPCPVEIYEHRTLALCDNGIQSIGYSELDDMFILRDPTLFLGGCTSRSFVPHFCCDPETTVPDMNIYAYCWPYPIDYDVSALPQSALSTFAWWEFFNPR